MVLRCIEVSGCESVEVFSMALRGYGCRERRTPQLLPRSLAIRIEGNDIEVLYAPRPSAHPSATAECPELMSAPQICS
jgi:hypothetical protein